MSTIEKAAAKLAARGKVAVSPAEPSIVRPARPEPQILERPDGSSYVAPQRWCDINLDHLTAKGFISPKSGRGQLAQEMRRIKRPLLLNIKKAQADPQPDVPPANLIMITSALPDEGKTFIAINLAMSLAAELDRRVLLVDADVAKGDVTKELEIEVTRGLTDLLAETGYFAEEGVLTSNVDRLSILPAGEPNDHMDELFASNLMGDITRSLAAADPERIVVFDASPLLATTEPAVLARLMGQIVVVVEANKTPQDAVSEALTQLEGCANVSLVLNKTNRRESGGYHYGYGYGYDKDDRKEDGDEVPDAREQEI
jgi:protein-tyrosine kinase